LTVEMGGDLRSLLRRRIYFALIATAYLIAVLAAGSLTPLDAATTESLLAQANELLSTVSLSPLAILANNFLAMLLMIIPALGIIASTFIVYTTGLIISALAGSQGLPALLLLAIPFATVYGLLEMMAYGIAVSESALVVYAILKRRLMRELRILPIAFAAATGLLFVAAVIEFFLIEFLNTVPAQ